MPHQLLLSYNPGCWSFSHATHIQTNLTQGSPCFTEEGKHTRHKAKNMGTLEILWPLSGEEQPVHGLKDFRQDTKPLALSPPLCQWGDPATCLLRLVIRILGRNCARPLTQCLTDDRHATNTVSTVFSLCHLARGLIPKKIILVPTIKSVF